MPPDLTVLHRRTVLGAGAALIAMPAISACAAPTPKLDLVATFPKRQVTGVAVSPTGRIFVNFPRWEADVPISVAEVGQAGALTPFPDAAWNDFRDAAPANPAQSFVCL